MPGKKPTRSDGKAAPVARGVRTPWPLEVRLRVARAVVDEGLALGAVARACGVSANTAILWVRRYRARGVDGLLPAVALPPVLPKAAEARREAVVTLRRAHPEVGARRIRDILQRFQALGVSERTVRRVLHEEGLSTPPPPARAKPRPGERRFERAEPNQLWQSDLFTFLLRRHERVYVAASWTTTRASS